MLVVCVCFLLFLILICKYMFFFSFSTWEKSDFFQFDLLFHFLIR